MRDCAKCRKKSLLTRRKLYDKVIKTDGKRLLCFTLLEIPSIRKGRFYGSYWEKSDCFRHCKTGRSVRSYRFTGLERCGLSGTCGVTGTCPGSGCAVEIQTQYFQPDAEGRRHQGNWCGCSIYYQLVLCAVVGCRGRGVSETGLYAHYLLFSESSRT